MACKVLKWIQMVGFLYMLSTHPPLVRLFNFGRACTAVAANAVTIKSAAANEKAPDDRLSCGRDDFMVTNYIDGIISGD